MWIAVATLTITLLVGILIPFIGLGKIRRWLRLAEPEPYVVARNDIFWLEKRDSVVGPILEAEREAGSWFDWRSTPTQESGGWKYLRTERRKIVYRSDELAHSKEIVLMVGRTQGVAPDRR